MKRRQFSFQFALPQPEFRFDWRAWLPSRGNVLFTLVMIGVLLWAQSAGAVPFRAESAASTGTIAYQGRLADSSGNPLTSTLNMSFRLYNASTGGAPLWTEQWSGPNGVKVSDGLFNVMLGSLTPIAQSVITGNANLFLGITVGTDDEMTPRVQLGSVPFAVQALTVPDGSITTAKLADGAVTTAKLASSQSVNLLRGFTPSVSSDFLQLGAGLHRWLSSGQSRVLISFKVPDDYVSGDLVVREVFQEHDTGSGTVANMTREITRYRKSNGAGNTIASGATDYTFGSGFRIYSIPAGNFEAGDLIGIQERRDGDGSGDNAGRIDLLSIGIEYTGK